jgi:hypothetical protein
MQEYAGLIGRLVQDEPMNANPGECTKTNAAFQKLLSIGLAAWFLTQVSLVAARLVGEPRGSWIGAVEWAIGYSWLGFLAGLLAMVAAAFRHPGGFRPALIAYLVPLGLYAIIGAAFQWIYPDRWFLTEILGIVPLLWLFGVFGWLWLQRRPAKSSGDALTCALLPPLVAGLAIAFCLGFKTFRSDAFIYRNAFGFDVRKTNFSDGKLAVDAVIEIRKPGNYVFRATKYSRLDAMNTEDPAMHDLVGRIEWADGNAPKAAETGTYPLTIRWDKSVPPSSPADDPMGEDCIVIDVFDGKEKESAIMTLSALLRAE